MSVKRTADSIMRLADPLPDSLRPATAVASTDQTVRSATLELATMHPLTPGRSRRSKLTLAATSAVIAAAAVLVGLAVLLPNTGQPPATPGLSGAASSTPTASRQPSADPRAARLQSQAASQAKLVQCQATANAAFTQMITLYNRALAAGDSAAQANQQALAGLTTLAEQPGSRATQYARIRAAWNRNRVDILDGSPPTTKSIC